MEKEIKVHYLYNSGFTVETENYLMIFDYYIDSVEKGEKCIHNGAIGLEDLKTEKKIMVFVSHKHEDHFNPVIFEWSKERPDIEYIVSNDLRKKIESNYKSSNSNSSRKLHLMKAYQEIELSGVNIRTFGSTDVGVSFLVTVDSTNIFHAGDLNWWYWYNSTEKENKQATGMFKAEIEKIKSHCFNRKIEVDIAFFPVDKRLKEAYSIGAEHFIDKIEPAILVPMHFGVAFEATGEFAERMKDAAVCTRVIQINHRGQELNIKPK